MVSRRWPAAARTISVAVLVPAVLAGCRAGNGSATPAPPGSASATARPTGLGGAAGEQTPSTPDPPPTPSAPVGTDQVAGSCPYISAADFADLEGDRVGRVTVSAGRPVGCRFYLSYDPAVIVGEITVARFATATEAYNAMVSSARNHPEVQSDAGIADGAVAYRTDLQGTRTWQCVFARGTSVVTVRTRQPYPAWNAFSLARAIAPKIQ